MFTTQQVLALLRFANPTVALTEDRVRHAVRRQLVEPPDTFGGRWAWRWSDVQALAAALDLNAPTVADLQARRAGAASAQLAGAAR
jgi:hypothetical protein